MIRQFSQIARTRIRNCEGAIGGSVPRIGQGKVPSTTPATASFPLCRQKNYRNLEIGYPTDLPFVRSPNRNVGTAVWLCLADRTGTQNQKAASGRRWMPPYILARFREEERTEHNQMMRSMLRLHNLWGMFFLQCGNAP